MNLFLDRPLYESLESANKELLEAYRASNPEYYLAATLGAIFALVEFHGSHELLEAIRQHTARNAS